MRRGRVAKLATRLKLTSRALPPPPLAKRSNCDRFSDRIAVVEFVLNLFALLDRLLNHGVAKIAPRKRFCGPQADRFVD
jgi:hypothetical protein